MRLVKTTPINVLCTLGTCTNDELPKTGIKTERGLPGTAWFKGTADFSWLPLLPNSTESKAHQISEFNAETLQTSNTKKARSLHQLDFAVGVDIVVGFRAAYARDAEGANGAALRSGSAGIRRTRDRARRGWRGRATRRRRERLEHGVDESLPLRDAPGAAVDVLGLPW